MPSSWSTRREVSPETSRLLIERAHEELIGGNDRDPRLSQIRPLVQDSWRRSLAHLVGAEALPQPELTDEELEAYRKAHPLAEAMGMIRQLLTPDAESGVVIAVGDAVGRLLWVEGDRSIRTLAGRMGFIAGTNWSEAAVGTAAPGTALALGRSVQIHGAEHFNRFAQPWSCTAAPVHDPETRRVLGVIDVTGGADAATPQAQLLVDATARAVEGELLVARLRARAAAPPAPRRARRAAPDAAAAATTLRVLGRDRALLEVAGPGSAAVTELSARHAELLLMLAVHRQGLSAQRLGQLVYGEDAEGTLRAELVRLRKVLERVAPQLVPATRPYRLSTPLHTDAHQVVALLDRGAHRVALTAYRGRVLPDSVAPGVEEFRESVRQALRDALLAEGSVEVLLAFADTDDGSDDTQVLRLALEMLPPRSPRRAGLVARIEKLEA
ncbi:GAF domain-containing protein [Microbacterium sp.]|uniref:GAF domain-containing protein n=1 Tax=Microbacterium sp. TaxID=51671 RepID=UPI0039E24F9B